MAHGNQLPNNECVRGSYMKNHLLRFLMGYHVVPTPTSPTHPPIRRPPPKVSYKCYAYMHSTIASSLYGYPVMAHPPFNDHVYRFKLVTSQSYIFFIITYFHLRLYL